MSTLINNYPIFEDNQVLTSGQLNQLHKYLDQQTRLTRSCLIGMGIACGLELEVTTGQNTNVVIHEGIGISSEGFLIKLCPESGACTTVQYRAYNLPEGVVYTPFQDAIFQQDVALYELLTEEVEVDEDEQLISLTKNFLNDKVAVLFLECLDNDLKSCLGKSCDELGIDRIFNLRKLLISVDDLNKVNSRTNGGRQDDLFLKKDDLRDLGLPRVLFDDLETKHYFPFAFAYVETMIKGFTPLKALLNATYTVYEPILNKSYGENPFSSSIIENTFKQLEAYLAGGLTQPSWWGVQYVYDFYKDLILAYEEFRETAYALMLQCCPDMNRFPRHLMLGKVINQQPAKCEVDAYRHRFTQPPIFNLHGQLLDKTISLHKRIVLLLEKFSFERLQNMGKVEVKVTPSCEKKSSLSMRSIPFYYDSKSTSNFEALENLEVEWNFERKQRQCQLWEKESDALNLSYDNNSMAPEGKTPLTTPLHFDLDQLNFLRLEGIHGRGIQETMAGLNKIKTEYNLNFDIKTIYFGDESVVHEKLLGLRDCHYKDLQPHYAIWRGKLLYFLGSFSRLISGSRFLQRKNKTKNDSNIMSEKDTSELYEELNKVRGVNLGLDNNNWYRAMDEVHYKTKEANRAEWIKREKEAPGGSAAGVNSVTVDSLHAQIDACLIAIRNRTPESFEAFNMTAWLEAYKCPLDLFTNFLKLKAGEIPNNGNLTKVHVVLRLIAAVQELMRNLFIYPYIDIRVLHNTLVNRISAYHQQHSFGEFLKHHPGLEHKAGVAQGQTFVLLYQDGFSDRFRAEMKGVLEKWTKEIKTDKLDIDAFFKLNEEGAGRVLADFTLPYQCCDPCTSVGVVTAHLDPLAVPINEIVPTRINNNKEAPIQYEVVEEHMLHSMYEPERYRIKLSGNNGKYGEAKLNVRPHPFDPHKEIQTFIYSVDEKKVLAASGNNTSAYLIEDFPYTIEKVGNTELRDLDSSNITIIIPIIPKGDITIGIKGFVFYKDEKGRQISIENADVWTSMGGKDIGAKTDSKGMYRLTDEAMVNGTYELLVAANGFHRVKISKVVVKNEMTTQDVELIPGTKLKGGLKELINNIGFVEDSREAILLADEYKRSGKLYREIMEKAIAKERENIKTLVAVEKVITTFNEEAEISTEELNKTYLKNRDLLLKEMNTTTDKTTKTNRANSLKVLTNSYMDRLIINEGKNISAESEKTLSNTAKALKKAGVNMEGEMKEWSKSKSGVLGKEIVANITKNFKV